MDESNSIVIDIRTPWFKRARPIDGDVNFFLNNHFPSIWKMRAADEYRLQCTRISLNDIACSMSRPALGDAGVLMSTSGEDVRIDASNVQQALAALQDKSLIWREKRGVYALEEVGTAMVMRRAGLLDGAA